MENHSGQIPDGDCKVLVINLYHPNDSQKKNDNCDELLSMIAHVKGIVRNDDRDERYLLGDLNYDDKSDSDHAKYIDNFLQEFG